MQDKLVKCVPVDVFYTYERPYIYSATDVNSNNIRDDPLPEIAGKADYAACPGMHIGHDANFALSENIDGHQLLDLLNGVVFNVVSIDFYIVVFYGFHFL